MGKIELNQKEHAYLCQSSFLNDQYKKLLPSSQQYNEKYLIEVSENQADEIRDLCGEQLQIIGFNKEYELTVEGKILESLVDKFFM